MTAKTDTNVLADNLDTFAKNGQGVLATPVLVIMRGAAKTLRQLNQNNVPLPPQWQPIETAPIDETVVLAFEADYDLLREHAWFSSITNRWISENQDDYMAGLYLDFHPYWWHEALETPDLDVFDDD